MRDIDQIIDFINTLPQFSPVEKQVLINRIERYPSRQELEQAREQVHPLPSKTNEPQGKWHMPQPDKD